MNAPYDMQIEDYGPMQAVSAFSPAAMELLKLYRSRAWGVQLNAASNKPDALVFDIDNHENADAFYDLLALAKRQELKVAEGIAWYAKSYG